MPHSLLRFHHHETVHKTYPADRLSPMLSVSPSHARASHNALPSCRKSSARFDEFPQTAASDTIPASEQTLPPALPSSQQDMFLPFRPQWRLRRFFLVHPSDFHSQSALSKNLYSPKEAMRVIAQPLCFLFSCLHTAASESAPCAPCHGASDFPSRDRVPLPHFLPAQARRQNFRGLSAIPAAPASFAVLPHRCQTAFALPSGNARDI